jgi:hypothetical protein
MKVNADLGTYNAHAELLPGRPAHLVASAPHSSGLSAGSASCLGCQTRSKQNAYEPITFVHSTVLLADLLLILSRERMPVLRRVFLSLLNLVLFRPKLCEERPGGNYWKTLASTITRVFFCLPQKEKQQPGQ